MKFLILPQILGSENMMWHIIRLSFKFPLCHFRSYNLISLLSNFWYRLKINFKTEEDLKTNKVFKDVLENYDSC